MQNGEKMALVLCFANFSLESVAKNMIKIYISI